MTSAQQFWDKEYKNPQHLSLSDEPAEDLEKFTRWLSRNDGDHAIYRGNTVLDLGSGNGRNLIYLAREFHLKGVGYDISQSAVDSATKHAQGLPLTFTRRSIAGPIDMPDNSATLVLDMMTSHYLNATERAKLRDEIYRVLEPGGFLFFKSFLAEGDLHAERLLRDFPGKEPFTYVHPKIGVQEYVWTEDRLRAFFGDLFNVKRVYKSHKHLSHGRAFRRRTISAYIEKPWEMAR